MPADRNTLAGLRIDRSSDRGPVRRRAWPWGLGAVALLAVGAAAWWVRADRPARVRTVVVEAAAGRVAGAVLNASGYVTARRRATVSSKITGKVVDVRVEEGLAVEAGQILARLDDASARTALSLAEAQLAAATRAIEETSARLSLARLTLERTGRLVAEGVVGEADLDAARAEVDALEARLDLGREERAVAQRRVALARIDLEDTLIRAPFAGVAISKDAQPGEMISPVSAGGGFTRTGICTIVDMGSLEIEVDVNEAYINRVVAGQAVEATLDAYPDWRVAASVITTIPAADRQKATVKVRIAFEKPDPRILPDMGVKVVFLGAEGEAPAGPRIEVPASALRREGTQAYLLVVRDGRVERRAVQAGVRSGDRIEILSGVADGDRVVVEGPAGLADGDRVEEAP